MSRGLITRRAGLLGLGSLVAAPLVAPEARAQLFIDVRRGSFQPIPIAIADFGGDGELGPKASGIVANNLTRSGYFTVLDRGRFPDNPSFDAAPNFGAWRQAGVQGLVTGRVGRDASGRMRAEFRLWDVASGQQLIGQQYGTDANSWRRVAHIISDAVYSKITGVGGFFDTRIAFVDESGPKERRKKRLAVMDQDGANAASSAISTTCPRARASRRTGGASSSHCRRAATPTSSRWISARRRPRA